MPNTIEDWVEYIQSLHVREIDLSLDRVKEVYQRLRPKGLVYKVITVAGTNGKGSTCELLASIYQAAGYVTGKYTSPHIELFNERFNINRQDASDQQLLDVFARIEQARESVRLTYFEFGTLIAIELFAESKVDIAIMEVGLGGRLDAINILDADVAIVTSISIDHTDWLGSTIEEIAKEKIGISRPNNPCVIGILETPPVILDYCRKNKVPSYIIGTDFQYSYVLNANYWHWQAGQKSYQNLPLPYSQSGVQLDNAAVAIQAVNLLNKFLSVQDQAIYTGIEQASLAARCQVLTKVPLVIVDVAHNQASIARLRDFIATQKIAGKVYALCGMLKDKQIEQSLSCLIDVIDEWNFVSINNSRGSEAILLAEILSKTMSDRVQVSNNANIEKTNVSAPQLKQLMSFCFDDVPSAYDSVVTKLNNDDGLIVFGSFFVVSDIMRTIQSGDVANIH